MLKIISLLLKGFVLGFSMMLPGLSGGTIAFVLGIYEKIISEISKFQLKPLKKSFSLFSLNRKKFKQFLLYLWETWDKAFLIPLMTGVFLSIGLFAVFALPFIEQYSLQFYSIVCGLVLASTLKPLKEIKKTRKTIFLLFLSFIVNTWLFAFGESLSLFSGSLAPILFLPVGFLISIALILPGLSGSYLLVILGLYEQSLLSLRQGELSVICFFILGAILGLFSTAKSINYYLKNYFDETLAVLLGLILGSLYAVYPLAKQSLQDILQFDTEKQVFLIYFIISFFVFIGLKLFLPNRA